MKAMVLAAGLGTRLRPLTDDRPKALVEVAGRTLLEIALTRLKSFGVTEAIVNVHHFAEMVIDYLKSNNNFAMRVELSREDILLDTGGGLKKAAWFFQENSGDDAGPFFLHNVDVLSSIDLALMVQAHKEKRSLVTVAVQKRESSRQLLFDEHGQLCGRVAGRDREKEIVRPAQPLESLAFSGIHVISPRLLPMMTAEGVFSIIDTYLCLSGQGEKITAFRADKYYWRDLGKPESVTQAEKEIREHTQFVEDAERLRAAKDQQEINRLGEKLGKAGKAISG
jgi:NDP-sugar pyrophosphorylase family protein